MNCATSRLRLAAAWLLAGALAGCASLPPPDAWPQSQALSDTADTRLARAAQPVLAEQPGKALILPLTDGREAFAARVMLALAAERSLDIQVYIWHGDTTGMLMFEQARAAAERGVRVRLLIDDNNTAGLDPVLALLDAHPNIELRLFNPFAQRGARVAGYLTDFSRLNRRMHNKSFTVDNQATIVGGRNIGDEYYAAGDETNFADLDLVVLGDVVREVSHQFDLYWNSPSAYPAAELLRGVVPLTAEAFAAEVKRLRELPSSAEWRERLMNRPGAEERLRGRQGWERAVVRLVYDDPEKVLHPPERQDLQMFPRLVALIGKPQRSFDLVSPYFVPGEDGAAALAEMARSGVRVRVLTNSLAATDVGAVHAGYSKRREALLAGGVTLYELKPLELDGAGAKGGDKDKGSGLGGSSHASLHAKTFAVDGERIFVGSFNFDPRSARLNTEMGLVVDSPTLAGRLGSALDKAATTAAWEVRLGADGRLEWLGDPAGPLSTEPQSGLLRRTGVTIMTWLPIEWLL